MKTLLLRPFIDSGQGTFPPVSLMYLSSYLKSKQHDVTLIDICYNILTGETFSSDRLYAKRLLADIRKANPDIIGMTLFSRELNQIAQLCSLIKREFPSVVIVLGGSHPTAMPEETLTQISGCDFVVRGEGEQVLHELIGCLSRNTSVAAIKGISFRSNGRRQIVSNADADVISSLDSLPLPDRESLLDNYRRGVYRSLLFGSPVDNVMTSRGCAFSCNFCSKVCVRYRSLSPASVIREIDWIISAIRPSTIQFMDDAFTLENGRCEAILDMMIERKYPCKFTARSRVDAVSDGLLKKMKRAGIDTIIYGFESGSQRMLDAFNKRTTVAQNIAACVLAKKHRLNCFGHLMLFYPGETQDTLCETEAFIRRAKPTLVQIHMFTPLPKTKIYEETKQNDSLVGDWEVGGRVPWVKIDGFDSVEQMERYAKKMRKRIMLSPSRIIMSIKAFGVSLLKNPIFSLRMIFTLFTARAKY
jgi:radical SAM superfamily enzyme YgiQ (UPF0313 family)